jgi:hypothetical protein
MKEKPSLIYSQSAQPLYQIFNCMRLLNSLNKIKSWAGIFIMPFCVSVFICLILIGLFNLQISHLNRDIIFYLGLIFGFSAFFFWFRKLEEGSKTKKIILNLFSPLFLMSIFIIALSNIDFLDKINIQLIIFIKPILILISIFLGLIIFYDGREKIEQEIDKQNNKEKETEQKRYLNFPKKFPKIYRIPILKNLIRLIYKEGWIYSLILFIIILLSLSLRLWNIGSLSFWVDETQSIVAANNFINTGIPYYQENLIYLRAPFYTLLNVLTIWLFGLTEFTIRLTPLIFSMLTLVTIYIIIKKILNKNFALVASFIFGISSYALLYARYNRFYAALSLLILLNIYLFYTGFVERNKNKQIFCILIAFVTCGFEAKSIVFLPILCSFLFLLDYKNYKIENYKSYFKWLKEKSLIAQRKLWIYVLTATSSFLIFSKIDSINTLTGDKIRTFKTEKFNIDLPVPGFIKEIIYPEWNNFFFNFIKDYYPIIFIGIICLFIFLIIKIVSKKTLGLRDLFIYYLLLNLIFLSKYIVNVIYYTWDQRHFSFIFGLLIINFVIFLSFLIKSINQNKKILILIVITIIYSLSTVKQINSVINMKYGDSLLDTNNLVMKAEPYRSDYKTPFQYVSSNYQDGDIIFLSSGGNRFADLYLKANIKYALFDKDNDELEYLISQNKSKNIWVIDVMYDMKKYHAKYRWGESFYFMEEHKDNIVYYGLDQKTRVFLFK